MRQTLLILPILLAANCTDPAATGNETSVIEAAEGVEAEAGTAATDASPSPTPTGPASNMTMESSAWRVTGEDGAIYTTYIDPDGTYRDFKNGDPWNTGTWERLPDGRLCYSPHAEDRSGACWALDGPHNNGVMRATNDSGFEIELQQVTYAEPEEG